MPTPPRPILARRAMLGLLCLAPFAGGAASAAAEACVDLEALPRAQKSLRRSANFQLQSDDPAKVCGGCAFFTPGSAAPNCGACSIFGGGAVTAASRCDSWAARR
ncbi:MAG: hypothetical protein JWQ29_2229 [Phenylobacterium sp.]|nr:hypothetical protein [Phenylobacterium sp.]